MLGLKFFPWKTGKSIIVSHIEWTAKKTVLAKVIKLFKRVIFIFIKTQQRWWWRGRVILNISVQKIKRNKDRSQESLIIMYEMNNLGIHQKKWVATTHLFSHVCFVERRKLPSQRQVLRRKTLDKNSSQTRGDCRGKEMGDPYTCF